jgi:disulfide oxidoreductase YuzD
MSDNSLVMYVATIGLYQYSTWPSIVGRKYSTICFPLRMIRAVDLVQYDDSEKEAQMLREHDYRYKQVIVYIFRVNG